MKRGGSCKVQQLQFKQQKMSTINHFRLALLEQLRYHHQLEELISLKEEIEELRDKVALFQKKHRRCDRDITKHEQCPYCQRKYGSEVALKLHLKLKHPPSKSSTGSSSTVIPVPTDQSDKQNHRNN